MEILIQKDRIYPYVERISSQIGKMTETYSNTTITRDNWPVLDSYMEMVVSEGEAMLHKLIGQSNNFSLDASSQNILITIKDNKRNNTELAGLVKTQIMMFCCNMLISMWYASVNADISKQYKETAAGNIKSAHDAILFRANYHVDCYEDGESDMLYHGSSISEEKEMRNKDKESGPSAGGFEAYDRESDKESSPSAGGFDASDRESDKESGPSAGGFDASDRESDTTENKEKKEIILEERDKDLVCDEASNEDHYQMRQEDVKKIVRDPPLPPNPCCIFNHLKS